MKQGIFFCITLSLFLNACFKDDERVKPYEGITTLIPDSIQVYQSYFDFETGRVVKSILMNTWQLGFECGASGWHIITNSGDNWFIYNTNQTVPDPLASMPGRLDHLYDVPSAFPDSTAIGDWVSSPGSGPIYTHNTYLLGYYHAGKFNMIRQLVFLDVNDTVYHFYYKEVATGISDTVMIRKNDSVNYVYYSFAGHSQVNLEPDKSEWDLAFGPYYDLATLFDATIPYPVGGSFINPANTEAVLDSLTPYNEIDSVGITGYTFSSQRNIPGYKWKSVTVDVNGSGSATYDIKTRNSYIIHTASGSYYKFRFLSYTHDGCNGFPQFEYLRLEGK